MPATAKNFAMEQTLPMLSEQHPPEQTKDRRQYVRKMITLRMIAADKAGLANGQVIDVTTRGARLRLTKPLTREQYLTLKVYLNDGTGSVHGKNQSNQINQLRFSSAPFPSTPV